MSLDQQRLFPTPQEQLTSDDYYTPAWIFDALGLHFDLDVASPPGGPPFVPCDQYYTQEDDGLAQPWHGRVWMNPPYSKPSPWVEKWRDHANGVALLPAAKSRWFQDLWSDPNVVAVVLPLSLKFIGGAVFMPCMMWAIGSDNVRALSAFGMAR
jgi:phage N-6-adenine-methyltransferase